MTTVKIRIEVDDRMLKDLVMQRLENILGDIPLDKTKVKIQTKSKQNYRSEWETAEFRAVYEA